MTNIIEQEQDKTSDKYCLIGNISSLIMTALAFGLAISFDLFGIMWPAPVVWSVIGVCVALLGVSMFCWFKEDTTEHDFEDNCQPASSEQSV